jgi:hypothetical protein
MDNPVDEGLEQIHRDLDELEERSEEAFHPNLRPADTGLMCPFNMHRPCNADCMSYTTAPRHSSNSELNEQQAHCALIVGLDRLGRNVTILTEMMVRGERQRRADEADKKRETQFTHPDASKSPFGGGKKQ